MAQRRELLHEQLNVHDIGMRLWMEAGRQVLAKTSAVRTQARYLHVSLQYLRLVGTAYLLACVQVSMRRHSAGKTDWLVHEVGRQC